jgi:hypothetical protein
VDSVGALPGIGPVVLLSETGHGFRRSQGYDPQTGRLLVVGTDQQVGQAVQQTRLQLVR